MWGFIQQYWMGFVFGIIGTAIARQVSKLYQKQKSSDEGLKSILRDRIIQWYNFHYMKGECTIHDMDALLSMYESYIHLGGNGTIKNLVEACKEDIKIMQEVKNYGSTTSNYNSRNSSGSSNFSNQTAMG